MRYLFGPFVLDEEQRRLFKAGVEAPLQPKAYEVLRLLVARMPRASPRTKS